MYHHDKKYWTYHYYNIHTYITNVNFVIVFVTTKYVANVTDWTIIKRSKKHSKFMSFISSQNAFALLLNCSNVINHTTDFYNIPTIVFSENHWRNRKCINIRWKYRLLKSTWTWDRRKTERKPWREKTVKFLPDPKWRSSVNTWKLCSKFKYIKTYCIMALHNITIETAT